MTRTLLTGVTGQVGGKVQRSLMTIDKQVKYELIEPVPEETHRPKWSVMIPTYNGTQYLEQTLRSVLEQDPGPEQMHIEVIDDCSTKDDPETIVKEVGQGRISFFRQPRNVGLVGNWNACVQRSLGQWVHILHQDDIVLTGFYNHLRKALETEPSIGAAFCRHVIIDEDGHWHGISPLERRTPGILANWIEKIAVTQQLQFPSIVVKRCVYEKLGAFYPEVHFVADWEMWKRISAYYPVWFEPQILACYRQHSASETSRLVQSTSDIVDVRRAIEIAESYLPPTRVRELSRLAREDSVIFALDKAKMMLSKDDFTTASAQIREAFRCNRSFKTLRLALPVFRLAVKRWLQYNYVRSKKLWKQS